MCVFFIPYTTHVENGPRPDCPELDQTPAGRISLCAEVGSVYRWQLCILSAAGRYAVAIGGPGFLKGSSQAAVYIRAPVTAISEQASVGE